MLKNIHNRFGRAIIYLKYDKRIGNTNKLQTTVSVECYFMDLSKTIAHVLLSKEAKLDKATFNNRTINL